jgi:hypothetical protein
MDTPQPSNHEYVLWILLAFSALHMVEEYAFNWTAWARSVEFLCVEADMDVMNLAFIAIGISAAAVGWKAPSFSLSFPVLMLSNAVFHIVASVLSARINPGTFTAVAMSLPIGTLCFVFAFRDGVLTRLRAITAVATGLFIHAIPIFFIVFRHRFSY